MVIRPKFLPERKSAVQQEDERQSWRQVRPGDEFLTMTHGEEEIEWEEDDEGKLREQMKQRNRGEGRGQQLLREYVQKSQIQGRGECKDDSHEKMRVSRRGLE